MLKLKFFTYALCLTFAIAPISASFAGAPDYSKKKSGGVAFPTNEENVAATDENQDEVDPSQIEPAAGGYEEEEAEEKTLAEEMKLPRK